MTQLTWLSSHVFSSQSVFIKPNTLNWNCRTSLEVCLGIMYRSTSTRPGPVTYGVVRKKPI